MMYRIGVDVGGTNTDSVLASAVHDGEHGDTEKQPRVKIISSHKTPTTRDITTGICQAIEGVLASPDVQRSDILSVNIGTTHFINAIIETDTSKLARVAVLRLCGPFCREIQPFADFPPKLRAAVQGHVGYLSGGLEIDGRVIGNIDEAEVLEHVQHIRDRGDSVVVVAGVFSPLDTSKVTQEEAVKRIMLKALPEIEVVCSRDIGNVGFVERENASILNGSILRFGRRTIRQFETALAALRLECPLYLTQNDGTVLSARAASSMPIKTFASGATNSLTGAVFLAGLHRPGSDVDLENSQVIMVDIGGTSSDFAALSPSGFPRQSPAVVKVGGVRTAFCMPEVLSLGLGGGSEVSMDSAGNVQVGPASVGYQLPEMAKCFGGDVLTATDIVVASGMVDTITPAWSNVPEGPLVAEARRQMSKTLSRGVELMKTSDLDVIALVVGGGSIIQIDQLEHVKRCIRPPFYNVANAVGAAIAKVSGELDRILTPGKLSYEQMVDEAKEQAIDLAIQNGAEPESVVIAEIELVPVAYTSTGAMRAMVKAVGELRWSRTSLQNGRAEHALANGQQGVNGQQDVNGKLHINGKQHVDGHQAYCNGQREGLNGDSAMYTLEVDPLADPDLNLYTPTVTKTTGEWVISEVDLAFIAEGVGILGTGGGGTVRATYLNAVHILRSTGKGSMRVIDPSRIPKEGQVALVEWIGSPSVSNERLPGGNEMRAAVTTLGRYLGIQRYDGVMASEIGGSNGMCVFAVAADMGIPIVDADTLGRAFPKLDMSLPYVYGKASACPTVLSDARGNVQIITSAENYHRVERMGRAICVELGLDAAMASNPLSGDVVHGYCCHRGLSTAWFIGRALYLARQRGANVTKAILSEMPGSRQLYHGKIIDVSRKVKGGWTLGTATVGPSEEQDPDGDFKTETRPLILQYQNEFLYAALVNPDDSSETLCTTPDLISVLDQDGSALQVHELRYGLNVSVIAMPAHPLWKTEAGMKAADPASFDLPIAYKPWDVSWQTPKSVMEDFGN